MRVDFGFTRVGRRSRTHTVTIPNTGTAPFRIHRAELTGPFAGEFQMVTEDFSGVEVHPGGACNVGLRFRPQGTGVRRAQLVLHTDSPDSPWLVILTGYAPGIFPERPHCPTAMPERRARVAVPVEIAADAAAGSAEVVCGRRRVSGGGNYQTVVQELEILVPVVLDVRGTWLEQGQRERIRCMAVGRVAVELPLQLGSDA